MATRFANAAIQIMNTDKILSVLVAIPWGSLKFLAYISQMVNFQTELTKRDPKQSSKIEIMRKQKVKLWFYANQSPREDGNFTWQWFFLKSFTFTINARFVSGKLYLNSTDEKFQKKAKLFTLEQLQQGKWTRDKLQQLLQWTGKHPKCWG